MDGVSYLMADHALRCGDGAWFAQLVVTLIVLVGFSLGTVAGMVYVLFTRRAKLAEPATQQQLGVLYAIYRPGMYLFEPVLMCFKFGLWSTLVFFDYGTELQLGVALLINILQLCVHVYCQPFGGDGAAWLNGLQTGTLVLTSYINFGSIFIKHLTAVRTLEEMRFGEETAHFASLETQINVMARGMEVLAVLLILTFAGTGVKAAVDKCRQCQFSKTVRKLDDDEKNDIAIDSNDHGVEMVEVDLVARQPSSP